MKFGLWVTAHFPESISATQWYDYLVEQVLFAKQAGFGLISSGQHYLTAPNQRLQTLPLLARLSAEGEGMEVATSVLLLPLHNPTDIAEQAATMDVITGGRFILGLGMGRQGVEFQAFGVDPRRIVSRYEESLDIVLKLWGGGSVKHDGRFFAVPEIESKVRFIQQPHPRIWLGGGSEAPINRAARYGFAWFPGGGSVDSIAEHRAFHLASLAEHGNPVPPDFPVGMWVYLHESQETAIEEAHYHLGSNLSLGEFREHAARNLIVGTPEFCVERVREYQERLGVTHLLCRLQAPGMGQEQVLRTIRLLGEAVIPNIE